MTKEQKSMPKLSTSGSIHSNDRTFGFCPIFIGDTMPEFELQDNMPALTSLNGLVDMFESYYMAASGNSASGKTFCNVIYNAKDGSIGTILQNHNYRAIDCSKAYNFIANRMISARKFLTGETFSQYEELNLRLKHIVNSKNNSEDPLGW